MSLTIPADLSRRLDGRRGACAVIAIKERARCKARLAESLGPSARIQLARSMLAAVLSAANEAQTLRQIILVSPERDIVPAEIPVLADTGRGLNSALTHALINRLVPSGEALNAALGCARKIAANGPLAVAVSKQVLSASEDWLSTEMFERQYLLTAQVFNSADAREGASAFAEKRTPNWRGE
jgi:enoyl-CoA hydratase/carnithine racemase